MQIRLIAALDENRGIGKNNKLPWSNREDMRHFSRITTGDGNNAVLMGKNTFLSIGKKLPNRLNIVLSRSIHPSASSEVNIVRTIDLGISLAKSRSIDTLWIIGGTSVYKEMINDYRHLIDDCVLSHIPGTYDCDTFFPILDSQWRQRYTFFVGNDMLEITYYKNLLKGDQKIEKNKNEKQHLLQE